MVSAGDGEDVTFHNSDSSNRVDGDRLGQWNAQHTYSNEFAMRKAHDGVG